MGRDESGLDEPRATGHDAVSRRSFLLDTGAPTLAAAASGVAAPQTAAPPRVVPQYTPLPRDKKLRIAVVGGGFRERSSWVSCYGRREGCEQITGQRVKLPVRVVALEPLLHRLPAVAAQIGDRGDLAIRMQVKRKAAPRTRTTDPALAEDDEEVGAQAIAVLRAWALIGAHAPTAYIMEIPKPVIELLVYDRGAGQSRRPGPRRRFPKLSRSPAGRPGSCNR